MWEDKFRKKKKELSVLIKDESSGRFPHFDKLVKTAIWRHLLSIQNEANSLVALRINSFWLVQRNHAAVKCKSSAVVIYTLPRTNQNARRTEFIARASVARWCDTNLAMHIGDIAQWISRLYAWVRLIINAMPCGLVSEVHSAFLRVVELQTRTPSPTERMVG